MFSVYDLPEITLNLRIQCVITNFHYLLIIYILINVLFLISQLLSLPDLQVRHQFPKISLCVFRVNIQHLFTVGICIIPFPVLKEHKGSLQKRCSIWRALYHLSDLCDRLNGGGCLLRQDLLDAPQKILHSADLAHILSLQVLELLRDIVSVDILIAGDEHLFLVLAHHREETAPFILYPDGIVILVIRTHSEHYSCAVKSGEDVRLVGCAQLVLKADAGEEHAVFILCEHIVDILRHNTVNGALSVVVRFLVADKNVIGLFLAGYFEYALLYAVDIFCFLAIDLACDGVSIFHSLLKVRVVHYTLKRRTVTGGYLLSRCRIINIFDTEFAQNKTPVCLRFFRKIADYVFINARCLVKFTGCTKSVCSGEKSNLLFVINLRNSLHSSAVFTFAHGHTL